MLRSRYTPFLLVDASVRVVWELEHSGMRERDRHMPCRAIGHSKQRTALPTLARESVIGKVSCACVMGLTMGTCIWWHAHKVVVAVS